MDSRLKLDDAVSELALVEQKLTQLRVRRKELRAYITSQRPAPEFVESKWLLQYIQPFVDEFNFNSPNNKGGARYLANRANVSESVVYNILNGKKNSTISFNVADKLMTGMGLTHIAVTMPVTKRVPNPPQTKFYED